MNLRHHTTAAGRFRAQVINPDGSVARDDGWHPNLILDSGLDLVSTRAWEDVMDYCAAGTDDTAVDASHTALIAEASRTNTYVAGQSSTTFGATGDIIHTRTYDFAAEASEVVYAEGGVSPTATASSATFSRWLFAGTVTVGVGQQLRVTYELTISFALYQKMAFDLGPDATGWPVTYNVDSVSDGGASFTVTTDRAHHYSAGERVVLAGVTPSGYNGEWVIDSVPTTTEITVAQSLGLGAAGAGGTAEGRLDGEVWFSTRRVLLPVGSTPSQASMIFHMEPGIPSMLSNIYISAYLAKGTEVRTNVWVDATPSSESFSGTGFTPKTDAHPASARSTAAYVPGSYESVTTLTWSTSVGNDTWKQLIMMTGWTASAAHIPYLIYEFTDLQLKESTHELVITFTRSWARA